MFSQHAATWSSTTLDGGAFPIFHPRIVGDGIILIDCMDELMNHIMHVMQLHNQYQSCIKQIYIFREILMR